MRNYYNKGGPTLTKGTKNFTKKNYKEKNFNAQKGKKEKRKKH